MKVREYIWACDPIGSITFIAGSVLLLLALNWVGATYDSSDAHVVAPLTLGCILLVTFFIYGTLLIYSNHLQVIADTKI